MRVAQQAHPSARAQRPWAQSTTMRVAQQAHPTQRAGATPVGPVDDDARHSTGPPLSYLTPGEHELVGYGSNELWGVHRYEARESMTGSSQMLKQVLIGGGVAAGVFAASAAIGLPTPVGIILAVVLFLLYAIAKAPGSD
jgi:hypothetical protein